MVKHVILWTLRDSCYGPELENIKKGIKDGLEDLKGKIPGLVDISVHTEVLSSSNADVILDSTFEDVASLKAYATHPLHVAVADEKVRPFTATRTCIDYEI